MKGIEIIVGDWMDKHAEIPDQSVHTCVTSPPYYALRDYGVDGQLGLEETPEMFIEGMVQAFRHVHRVLRDDGTLWLNLGDTYNGKGMGVDRGVLPPVQQRNKGSHSLDGARPTDHKLKRKDLLGIPWRVALALQADGWYLRQDIIWHKPNPMPESVRDRCTKSHEYLFLLSKSPQYYFDREAIAEPISQSTIDRISQPNLKNQKGSDRVPGKTNGPMKAVTSGETRNKRSVWSIDDHSALLAWLAERSPELLDEYTAASRNKSDMWTVSTKPFKGAHFATFPPNLIEPCVLAGCPEGGLVLDPFLGAGTTGVVAVKNRRRIVGSELNPEYAEMARRRINQSVPDPLFRGM